MESNKENRKIEKITIIGPVKNYKPFIDIPNDRKRRQLRYIEEEDKKLFPPVNKDLDFSKMFKEYKKINKDKQNNCKEDKKEESDLAQILYAMKSNRYPFRKELNTSEDLQQKNVERQEELKKDPEK